MTFFPDLKNSIYSPQYYSEVPKKSFLSAIVYFILLTIILTLIQTAFLIKPLFIEAKSQVRKYIQNVVDYFPSDLSVSIQDGKVTTTVEEPYVIPIPVSEIVKDDQVNLLIIDTQTPFSSTQFDKYHTIFWLTQESLYYKDDDGEISENDVSKFGDFTIDRTLIDGIAVKIVPYLNYLGPALMFFVALGFYLFYTAKLFQLLIIAILILLLGKFLKKNFTYVQSYKIGLYAMTAGLLVDLILSKTQPYLHMSGFPFMFTVITLVVVFANYTGQISIKPQKTIRRKSK